MWRSMREATEMYRMWAQTASGSIMAGGENTNTCQKVATQTNGGCVTGW